MPGWMPLLGFFDLYASNCFRERDSLGQRLPAIKEAAIELLAAGHLCAFGLHEGLRATIPVRAWRSYHNKDPGCCLKTHDNQENLAAFSRRSMDLHASGQAWCDVHVSWIEGMVLQEDFFPHCRKFPCLSDVGKSIQHMEDAAKRKLLIKAAELGYLSDCEAEAEASRLNIGPLQNNPDPEDFEPMKALHWTLPMIVKWVAWRNMNSVREIWNDFRAAHTSWVRKQPNLVLIAGEGLMVKNAFYLEQNKPNISLSEMISSRDLEECGADSPIESIHTACSKIWNALETGRMHATGCDIRSGMRTIIKQYEWRALRAVEFDSHMGPLDCACIEESGEIWGYSGVQVDTASILRVFPRSGGEFSPAQNQKRKRSNPRMDAAKRALFELFPDGVPQPSEMEGQQLSALVIKQVKTFSNVLPKHDTIMRAAGRRK